MKQGDIIVVGAGAAGLMAARELSKAGKSVVVLEARDRVGGRILPLHKQEFGYPAQGGAEFVDWAAPYTHKLAKEVGLAIVPHETRAWRWRNGKLFFDGNHEKLGSYLETIHKKLMGLRKDIPLAKFLKLYFGEVEHAGLRREIKRIVQEYDAADPEKVSTLMLRGGWLSGGFEQARINGGYGALITFLVKECKRNNAEVRLEKEVKSIDINSKQAVVRCADGDLLCAKKVIVTVPLPLLKEMTFQPALPHIKKAASKIGFGGAIKTLLKFKRRWWVDATDKDFFILLCSGPFVYWSQYPRDYPVLTAWASGPLMRKFAGAADKEVIGFALASLAEMFSLKEKKVRNMLVSAKVFNWSRDAYTKGGYSYPTVDTAVAKKQLTKPIRNMLYFAGEALAREDWASVDAALESGSYTARKVLSSA